MSKATYEQLSCACVDDNKNLIISKCIKNDDVIGITLAQQMMVQEGKKEIGVFLKNTIHIKDINALYELRNALNDAIDKLEEENE